MLKFVSLLRHSLHYLSSENCLSKKLSINFLEGRQSEKAEAQEPACTLIPGDSEHCPEHNKNTNHDLLGSLWAGSKGKDLPNFPLQGFNFLPYRHLQVLRQRAWRRSEFALAAGIGLIVACALQYHAWSKASYAAQNEKNLQHKLDNLQPQLVESQRLNTLIDAHQRRVAALTSLIPERLALATLFNTLAHFDQATVSLTQLKVEPGASTIFGVASDYAALSQWAQSLKQTGHFSNVAVAQVQHRAPSPNAATQNITPAGLAFSVHLNATSLPHSTSASSNGSKTSKNMPMPSISRDEKFD